MFSLIGLFAFSGVSNDTKNHRKYEFSSK